MRNVFFCFLTLIMCISCSPNIHIEDEKDFGNAIISEYGTPFHLDTAIAGDSVNIIRFISYLYMIESPNDNIVYEMHDYISKLVKEKATQKKDNLPAHYESWWKLYDLDFDAHLEVSREKKTKVYYICIQSVSGTNTNPDLEKL